MIVQEIVTIEGTQFKRTYSDRGYMLERDGALYEEAIDPFESNREYAETTIPCAEDDKATEADYQSALTEFGVKV